jgi:hypothetical protein
MGTNLLPASYYPHMPSLFVISNLCAITNKPLQHWHTSASAYMVELAGEGRSNNVALPYELLHAYALTCTSHYPPLPTTMPSLCMAP